MTEDLPSYLRRDLREALEAGVARTPAVSADGTLWLAGWALACTLVGLTLFLFCGYHAGFARANGAAAELPSWIWQWLTVLGDERVAFALTLFFTRRYPHVFWALIAAALFGIAFTHSLKPLFSALRPPGALDPESFNLIGPGHRKGSFPSGHSLTVTVLCAVWVYYLKSPWARGALILLATAAGMSRVAVGVHWPVDVAAGLMGGVLAAWAGVTVAHRRPWGALRPMVHLTFVAIGVMLAGTLTFSDGGYGAAAGMQAFVGIAALLYAAYAYLAGPALRWRRGREPAS